jgi:hypothetical protein
VRGTGYRKGRKGHPLPNIWRQWCDAKGHPCIVIEQDASGGSSLDVVVVDLAPLRSANLSGAVARCCALARDAGARQLAAGERALEAVPFDAIPVALPQSVEQVCVWPSVEGLRGGAADSCSSTHPDKTGMGAHTRETTLPATDAGRWRNRQRPAGAARAARPHA